MANTLTNLIPTVITALDVVSREQVGLIPSVNRNSSADRIAKNQTLYSWAAPAATLTSITAAATVRQASDKAQGTKSVSITNFKMTDFYFTGEETLAIGQPYGNMVTDLVEQAIRAIVNQIETDIWEAAYVGASRAYGTAAATPFGTNTGEAAQMKKILDDNGAPLATRSLVIDTTAGAALRTLTQLTKVNEAGTAMTLRDGTLLNLHGMMIKESAAITTATAGTAANATTNSAGYAIGAVTITLASAGTGAVEAGDVITFTGDTNKYVVLTGDANVAGGGTLVLAAPGLRKAIAASATDITVVATATRNLAFSRNAILLSTRLPAMPEGGDCADDRQVITDSRSGLSIELALYRQYRQIRYELAAAWEATVIKPEHLAVLLG